MLTTPHSRAELLILVKSHHFVVTRITPRGRGVVESFARKLIQWGVMRDSRQHYTRTALKVFAASTADRAEYRFHINHLSEFMKHLEFGYLTGDLVETIHVPIHPPVPVELPVKPEWTNRDYQTPVIDYMIDPKPPRLKLVGMATGQGKSYCAMRAASILGFRVLIYIKPMYIDKWIEDVRKTYEIGVEDLMVIRGSDQLMALLLLAEQGLFNSKIVIISTKTMQNWLKLYERFRDEILSMGYACLPDQLCEHLGIGTRLSDEIHQEYHLHFKLDLYTNVMHSLALSATLNSDDAFVNKMYEVAYPTLTRCMGEKPKAHVNSMAIIYRFQHPKHIKSKDYSTGMYSHHVFEKSVIKHIPTLNNYMEMINKLVRNTYMVGRKPGHKLIVFCASIDMCTRLTAFLSKKYLNLDVRRYVEDDPWENLMEPDIRVSTLQSAGTAVDIDGLKTTILTTAVSSSQSNIQGFGRIRPMKDSDTNPEFLYLVCEDIPKHIEYHERKKALLSDRSKSYKSVYMNEAV